MKKIEFTNEVGGKTAITFGIVIVSCLMVFLVIFINIYPKSVNLIGVIGTLLLTGVTAIILFLTLQTYVEILRVSEQTLSFTKTQTTFNTFFDNFKYFDDLSKRKIPFASEGGLNEMEKHFENLSFDTIHFNLLTILQNYPRESNNTAYEKSLNRLSSKIQPFIETLNDEVQKISNNCDLSIEQKINLINFYKVFILSDYINLCGVLIQNKEMFNSEMLPPIEITDLFKCNRRRINFDPEKFFKLYFSVDKFK